MFEKAETKASELEKHHEVVEKWKRKGDELVYSMMPRSVADVLKRGESPLSTCEVKLSICCFSLSIIHVLLLQTFDAVTILFCEIVGLTSETVEETMNVVACLNEVFSCFDELMDKFNTYRVTLERVHYKSLSLYF